MEKFEHTAILGAGVIGSSWAALFLAAGKSVAIFDPSPDSEAKVRSYVQDAWPTLGELGLADKGNPEAISFAKSPQSAVQGATFIQESVPEQVSMKHDIYQQIEDALEPNAIVSSSASGLTLTEMQAGWKNPAPLILGHPFNPPHLIPLVEVMGNDRTATDAVERAEEFYTSIGKVTIRVNKEIPGHVSNRLQAAVWREAIHLIQEGVASVEDVDKAISAGPGLRWAVAGPTQIFNLAAGPGGIREYCSRYSASFNRWWDDLGKPHMDEKTGKLLAEGITRSTQGKSIQQLAQARDKTLLAIQKAIRNSV